MVLASAPRTGKILTDSMVKFQEPSDYDKLDQIIRDIVAKLGLHLEVAGWTRKTYDIYTSDGRLNTRQLISRVESFATTSGEVRIFDDRATEFATQLGEAIENSFAVDEAVIIRESRPV